MFAARVHADRVTGGMQSVSRIYFCFVSVLLTHFHVKEGAAESWPCCNGFQEGGFGFLHCESTLLAVGVDDVLQGDGKRKKKELKNAQ